MPPQLWHERRARRAPPTLMIALVLVAVFIGPAAARRHHHPHAAADALAQPVVAAPTNAGLRPTRLHSSGRTHYYQLAENPIGVLVILHGCVRSARSYWPYDPLYCPECQGFPEGVGHVKQALRRGYTVLALEPNDLAHLCWSSSTGGAHSDTDLVVGTLARFLQEQGLTRLPLYLLGASSGSGLAINLITALAQRQANALAPPASPPPPAPCNATAPASDPASCNATAPPPPPPAPPVFTPQVQGIISGVNAPDSFDYMSDGHGRLAALPGGYKFPPVAFVRMQYDNSAPRDLADAVFLRNSGVPSGVIVLSSRPVGYLTFSDRTPVITQDQSRALVTGLQKIGLVDAAGWLTANPAKNLDKWTAQLQAALPWMSDTSGNNRTFDLGLHTSGLLQTLFVAYAKHEDVSDYTTACLAWLESKGMASLGGLASQLVVPHHNLTALTVDRVYPQKRRPRRTLRSPLPPPPKKSPTKRAG